MKRNLVVCPSRGRPARFMTFFNSFRATSKCSDLLVIIDANDPEFHNYQTEKFYSECRVNIDRRNTTQLFNWAIHLHQDYEFYSCTNDDFFYHTDGWDEKLCNKGRISYGNDLITGGRLPTTSVIDGEIIRALGWLQMPKLQFMCGDVVWKTIGHKLNILKYVPDVVIEHQHWGTGVCPPDETSRRVNCEQIMTADNIAYRDWLHNGMEEDVKRIRVRLEM